MRTLTSKYHMAITATGPFDKSLENMVGPGRENAQNHPPETESRHGFLSSLPMVRPSPLLGPEEE